MKIHNKKRAVFWLKLYSVSMMASICTATVIFSIGHFEYEKTCLLLTGFLCLFFFKCFTAVKYIEVENSAEIFSVKQYNLFTGTVYKQMEIPVSKIIAAKTDRAAKKIMLLVRSLMYKRDVNINIKLQYIGRKVLEEIERSLQNSIAEKQI